MPVPITKNGQFSLGAEHLSLGRVYLKLIGSEETIQQANWKVSDPFAPINEGLQGVKFPSYTSTFEIPTLRGNILLNEVKITGHGASLKDPFLAQLDSISKYEFNMDYVGKCNWLNCADCGSGKKPIEGVRYPKFKDGRLPRHYSFDQRDVVQEPYQYPKFTEEELIKKFNLFRVNGFQTAKEFYNPDYQVEPASLPDARTTLYWNPKLITDENGEAIVSFYTSDLSGTFLAYLQGITANGLMGKNEVKFNVINSSGD